MVFALVYPSTHNRSLHASSVCSVKDVTTVKTSMPQIAMATEPINRVCSTSSEENVDLSEKDKVIYDKLCALMETEQLYKLSDLQRDELAKRLGTNRTYLYNAIKSCAGESLVDFINSYRLKNAANLLVSCPNMSINEIERQSGFNSRETFNRTFRKYYGMTPSMYRDCQRG